MDGPPIRRRKLTKAMVINMIGEEEPLLKQVYGAMLCMHIWTRKGNTWYDPDYPGYSEHIDTILCAIEKEWLE